MIRAAVLFNARAAFVLVMRAQIAQADNAVWRMMQRALQTISARAEIVKVMSAGLRSYVAMAPAQVEKTALRIAGQFAVTVDATLEKTVLRIVQPRIALTMTRTVIMATQAAVNARAA